VNAARERRVAEPKQQVVVVAHDAVREAAPTKSAHHDAELTDEEFLLRLAREHIHFVYCAARDVMPARDVDPPCATHPR